MSPFSRWLSAAILLVLLLSAAFPPAATARVPASPGTFDCGAVTQIPTAECQALVALYNSTTGAGWTNKTGWLANNTPCGPDETAKWYGVACDTAGEHVWALYLENNHLIGSIPPALGDLGSLDELYLGSNQLSGIPPALGKLANLQTLSLWGNQMNGAIPPQLGDLANLASLDLSINRLSGGIPPELGNLPRLDALYLDSNQLTGSIPPQLGNLTGLEYLYLTSNQLTGAVPAELRNLANLWSLYLDHNQLSGGLPATLGQLAKLQEIYLNSNPSLGYNLPRGLLALPLERLYYDHTGLCEPGDTAFQSWLGSIPYLGRTGTFCTPKPVTLSGARQGTDIALQWTQGAITGYELHRSAAPYFTPVQGTLVLTLPVTTTAYTDTSAILGPNAFYMVRSKFQDSANDVSANSNRVGKWSFPVAPGH